MKYDSPIHARLSSQQSFDLSRLCQRFDLGTSEVVRAFMPPKELVDAFLEFDDSPVPPIKPFMERAIVNELKRIIRADKVQLAARWTDNAETIADVYDLYRSFMYAKGRHLGYTLSKNDHGKYDIIFPHFTEQTKNE